MTYDENQKFDYINWKRKKKIIKIEIQKNPDIKKDTKDECRDGGGGGGEYKLNKQSIHFKVNFQPGKIITQESYFLRNSYSYLLSKLPIPIVSPSVAWKCLV